jgi:hypothetical protein
MLLIEEVAHSIRHCDLKRKRGVQYVLFKFKVERFDCISAAVYLTRLENKREIRLSKLIIFLHAREAYNTIFMGFCVCFNGSFDFFAVKQVAVGYMDK